MAELRVAFLGDIVGEPGRRAALQAAAVLRASIFIANAENSRHGSGITPDHARELLRRGYHALTLGDHCYKDRAIIPMLADPAVPICRPANLSAEAPGKRLVLIRPDGAPPIVVVTVLGRLFMPMPADDPFACVDRELSGLADPSALVIVEIHGEATSEKQAMAWHCLERWSGPGRPRVVAVVGSHTHVQTADARIIDFSIAAITDLGMTGPHRSVIGRSVSATLTAMRTQHPTPLDVASDENRADGVLITLDPGERRPLAIEAFQVPVRG